MTEPKYQRVLLKLSGEALVGEQGDSISPTVLEFYAHEIQSILARGAQVAVVLGGGNIWRGNRASARRMDTAQSHYMGMLATIINALALQDALEGRGIVTRAIVEKPRPEVAPSNLAVVGRYVLSPRIFELLEKTGQGSGGEIQLTDAVELLIEEGHPVHVVVHRGARHDLGNPGGYLKAAVDFALERDDYGPELRRWLVERLGRTE